MYTRTRGRRGVNITQRETSPHGTAVKSPPSLSQQKWNVLYCTVRILCRIHTVRRIMHNVSRSAREGKKEEKALSPLPPPSSLSFQFLTWLLFSSSSSSLPLARLWRAFREGRRCPSFSPGGEGMGGGRRRGLHG